MTRGSPASALISVDLPALRLATIAIFISWSGSVSSPVSATRSYTASSRSVIPYPLAAETHTGPSNPRAAASAASGNHFSESTLFATRSTLPASP